GLPRLVVNHAPVSATNRLHHLYFDGMHDFGDLLRFSAAFLNPLTLATVEIASRTYGGGVLKIEPSDCSHILVPDIGDSRLAAFSKDTLQDIESLLRLGEDEGAIDAIARVMAETF